MTTLTQKRRERKNLDDMNVSQDARLPQADITNAPALFGDPAYGDVEGADDDFGDPLYGDPLYGDTVGDAATDTGDPDMLSLFSSISGDPESGDVSSWFHANRRKLIKAGAITAGVAASSLLVRSLFKAAKRRANARRVNTALARGAMNQNIKKTAMIQASVGKIARDSLQPFFSLSGAKMNSSPIDPLSRYVVDMIKYMLDRQNSDTPFLQESAVGAFAAGTWTATATGVATNRFYTNLILQIGTNVLNAAPGTVLTVAGTFPTIQGNLVVAANPWILTYDARFDVRFLFSPWQLVTNKPLPVLGQYANATPIIATVTGIPAASAVTLIVPGSQHPYTVALRNALIQ